MADTIIRMSFNDVWEDIGLRTKREIIRTFRRETGMSFASFAGYRLGNRGFNDKMADKLEEIFERFGYHDIWDKDGLKN